MAYLKGVLGTGAAMFLAVLIPMFWTTFRGISSQKATGLTAVAGGLFESILSPWFWLLLVLFSVFFYFASRFQNKAVRIVFFWIPTIAVSVGVLGFWSLLMFLILQVPRG